MKEEGRIKVMKQRKRKVIKVKWIYKYAMLRDFMHMD